MELLNQQISALRRQIAALESALDASEKKRQGRARRSIADLGQRLNVALAQRVQELSRYRSDFFGKLREILGNRPDIRVVGDRFVFQSEVFFDSGSAAIRPEGLAELDKLAARAARAGEADPAGDRLGAAHRRPHRQAADRHRRVPVELGAVRGARHLGGAVPDPAGASRRSAWSPPASASSSRSTPSDSEDAFRRNRRIELKLTER